MVINKKMVKKGAFYFAGNTSHEKNEKLLLARPPNSVQWQVVNDITLERKQTLVQFTLIFSLMILDHPMTDFEAMRVMLQELGVPNCPTAHWSVDSGWEMADSMFHIVQLQTREKAFYCHFIPVSTNEVMTIDNSPWILIQMYMVENWEHVPTLLSLSKLVQRVGVEAIKQ